jgi:hypothetical protein
MIDAFNVWLEVPEDKLKVIHKVIGMLHTSSLLYVKARKGNCSSIETDIYVASWQSR